MSVVFLVRSEEQLRSGADWCAVFAEAMDAPIVPLVVGAETKVLVKHTRSVLTDRFGRYNEGKTEVRAVDAEVAQVLEQCREAGCRLLVIVHSIDQEDWQRELFESSPYRSIWLCPAAAPPADEAHLMGGFYASHAATRRLAMKLFGMRPRKWCVTESIHGSGATSGKADEDGRRAGELREQFDESSSHPESLVIIAIESTSKENVAYRVARKLLDHDYGTSVALVRDGQAVVRGLLLAFRRWTDSVTPPLNRTERIALQEDLETGSKPGFEFLGLISASSMLAAFGLLQNSAAVIIGAMLIAPLMTPILGAGMAITLGNRPLFRTAATAIGLGFAGALASSTLFGGLVLLIDTLFGYETPDLSPLRATEMWARCNPSPIDFCVGLVGGMAAAYARTRTYLSSALAGAAIAAALVPPISTAGLQIAFGIWTSDAGVPVLGPLIVVSINVITIMAGSSLVLWLRGIRTHSGEMRKQDRWAIRVFVVLVALALAVLVGLASSL